MPQWALLVIGSVQPPSPQSRVPSGQTPDSGRQVATSTHPLPQSMLPAGHAPSDTQAEGATHPKSPQATVPVGHSPLGSTQLPAEHALPAGQGAPHAPQLAASLCRFAQPVGHAVVPTGQLWAAVLSPQLRRRPSSIPPHNSHQRYALQKLQTKTDSESLSEGSALGQGAAAQAVGAPAARCASGYASRLRSLRLSRADLCFGDVLGQEVADFASVGLQAFERAMLFSRSGNDPLPTVRALQQAGASALWAGSQVSSVGNRQQYRVSVAPHGVRRRYPLESCRSSRYAAR